MTPDPPVVPRSRASDPAGRGSNASEIASRFDATLRLATRVHMGEVVFFVGSGLSIDSEGNSATRLVGRLIAAVLAMDTILAGEMSGGANPDAGAEAAARPAERAAITGLRQVFGLAIAPWRPGAPLEPARCMTDANLKLLAREYYTFNEWAVSTLSVLSAELLALDEPRRGLVATRVQRLGTFLLRLVGDPVPLDPINCCALKAFGRNVERGKALFLDIMGFANPEVMAGTPREPDIEAVARSFKNRLRPRHHALARLAREGVARLVVTTNYDLLIEGAYRLAGFLDRESPADGDDLPPAAIPRFSSIAGADQFFARGEGHRTALVLKIHGSVDLYRNVRDARINEVKTGKLEPKDRWAAYLPAIVFTYREIQTWRADAWSRDLIRTLLRTNTLALCGYSGADPIMHATFREVYEERAATVPTPTNDSASEDIEKAPVFFFGIASKREFHSLEILAAATAAVGLRADKPVDHPNLIEFETSGFPTVDDHFRLIAHGVLREIQYQSLVTRLRRLAPQILRHPCPDSDYDALIRRFDALRKQERAEIDASGDRLTTLPAAERRRRFDHVVDWTWHFLPGFLRELTLADLVETRRGPGRALRQHRVLSSYQAASERPEWAAWAAIVELALREMVAVWSGATCGDPDPTNVWITAEESSHAAISFSCTKGPWQPQALLIRLAGFDRLGRSAGLNGAFKRVACWEFTERDLPWPLKRVKHDIRPDARTLWECAVGRPVGVSKVRRYLGAMS